MAVAGIHRHETTTTITRKWIIGLACGGFAAASVSAPWTLRVLWDMLPPVTYGHTERILGGWSMLRGLSLGGWWQWDGSSNPFAAVGAPPFSFGQRWACVYSLPLSM